MNGDHVDLKGFASAYVLGALDPSDRELFEDHLAGCPECAGEVKSLAAVAMRLAHAVPMVTPRTALRERVLAAVEGASAPESRQSSGASARASVARWLPLAATTILAIGLGVYAVSLRTRVADLEARLSEASATMLANNRALDEARRVSFETQMAMAVLVAPDLRRIDLAGGQPAPAASGRALWSRERGLVFTATNLPPLPEDRTYQVWVVTAQMPVNAGTVAPDPSGRGIGIFATPSDIGAPIAVAVTIEAAGGVPAPTNDRYVLIGKPVPQL